MNLKELAIKVLGETDVVQMDVDEIALDGVGLLSVEFPSGYWLLCIGTESGIRLEVGGGSGCVASWSDVWDFIVWKGLTKNV